jgi:hypothetical protein
MAIFPRAHIAAIVRPTNWGMATGMVIIIEGHVPQGVRVQVPPSALDMAPRGNWLNGKNNHLRRGARYGVMINRKGAHGYVAWTTM